MTNEILPALQDLGLLVEHVEPDGVLHRCATQEKPNSKNGWVLCFPDGKGAVCGNWAPKWSRYVSGNGSRKLTPADRERIAQARAQARRIREADQALAAERAQALYSRAVDASPDHAYLVRKQIAPCPGLKQMGKLLVVPVRNETGGIASLQFISPDGSKRFLRGGAMGSGFFVIRGDDSLPLYIAEGLATAHSIHAATGATVLVCFFAGNMGAVAALARRKYPERVIVLAGDNDAETDGNPGKHAALEAARAVSGLVALPELQDGRKCDWNDLHILLGIEAVEAGLQAAAAPEPPQADPWPEVIPYNEHDVPEIPCSVLPGWAGEFTREVCGSVQVPEALAVCSVLGAVSLAAAGAVERIELRPGYSEPLNLYLLSPLLPGERKSAALAAAFAPVYQWEADRADSMRDEIRTARSRRKSLERMIEQKRSRLARIQDKDELRLAIEDIAKDEAELPDVPDLPRLLADDVTPERLAGLMADQNEVLGIASAEGGIFDLLAGRYSKGAPNLDLFLKSHCAEPFRVDRVGRDPITLRAPRLVLTLAPQPEVMEALSGKAGFRSRGVIGRILFMLPNSALGYRDIETKPIPEAVAHVYASGLRRLLDMRGAALVLTLAPAAYARWKEFAQAVEVELRPGGEFEGMTDWAGKLPGAAARIAGLFHCVEADLPGARTVSGETMEQALGLAALLADHAREALGLMGCDPTRAAALKVLGWIKRTSTMTFTARDCFRALNGSFNSMEDLRPGLLALVERGYLRDVAQAPRERGRPSQVYEVNPELVGGGS